MLGDVHNAVECIGGEEMNFHLFCEHEGCERNFAHVGTATIGGLEFTVLECCNCFNTLALPGTLKTDLYRPEVTQGAKKIFAETNDGGGVTIKDQYGKVYLKIGGEYK